MLNKFNLCRMLPNIIVGQIYFDRCLQPPSESELSVTSGILGRLHKWNKNDSSVSING